MEEERPIKGDNANRKMVIKLTENNKKQIKHNSSMNNNISKY